MKTSLLLLCFIFLSCDNDSESNTSLVGKWDWTNQYLNGPAFCQTPDNPGLQETLTFNANGTYSVTRNNKITNSGTFKKIVAKNLEGKKVTGILYSNTRINDSIDYYTLTNNNTTLIFSLGNIDLVGSGSREYIKK